MKRVTALLGSAVGQKAAMALSGLVLFGFIFGHMLGNLKMYLGPESFNHYAEFLREIGYPLLPHSGFLWLARIGLLAAVVIHIACAWSVSKMSLQARPERYQHGATIKATYSSRTMRIGGVIIFVFLIYHLAQLTLGSSWAAPGFVPGDPYHNVVSSFSVWWVSLIYIVANVMLAMHLHHGLWSLFQSLGWNHPRYNPYREVFAKAFALIILVGNVSFPLAVMAGIVN